MGTPKPVSASFKKHGPNHFVFLSLDHLSYINSEWLAYYNEHRPHQGKDIGNKVLRPDFTSTTEGKIKREQRLGGIHSGHDREAA